MSNTTNQFFALLKDDSVKRISLSNDVTEEIKQLFIDAKYTYINLDTEEIRFDGNYNVQDNEILFVNYAIPDYIKNAINNPIGCHELDLNNDDIKGLFWGVRDGNNVKEVYLQNFDNRKLLKNKQILLYSSNTYSKLTDSAFILDDKLAAIFIDGKLLFSSYHNAKRLFDLSEFYKEATDEEIEVFTNNDCLELDSEWLKDNANTSIRKQITLALKSEILKKTNGSEIQNKANDFGFDFKLNNNKVVIPQDKKQCKDFLDFLNEKFYKGIFSGNPYRTNSNRLFKQE